MTLLRCVVLMLALGTWRGASAVESWPWNSADAVTAVLQSEQDPWRAIGGWLALATIGDPLFDGCEAAAMQRASTLTEVLPDAQQRAIARAWILAICGSAIAADTARQLLPEPAGRRIAAWARRDADLIPAKADDPWARAIRVRAWTACGYSSRARQALREDLAFPSGWIMRDVMGHADGPRMLADLASAVDQLRALALPTLPVLAVDRGDALGEGYLALRDAADGTDAGIIAGILARRLALLVYAHADDPRRLAPLLPAQAAIAKIAARDPNDALVLAVHGGAPEILRAALVPQQSLGLLIPIAQHLGPDDDNDHVVWTLLAAWRADGDVGMLGRAEVFQRLGSYLRWGLHERIATIDTWASAMRPYRFEWYDALADVDPAQLEIRARWQDDTVDRNVGNSMWPNLWLNDRFGIIWRAQVRIENEGHYRFATESDDASVLTIAGEVVVDNRGVHGRERRSGMLPLRAGLHALELRYLDVQWGAECRLMWWPPGADGWTVMPSTVLVRADGGTGLNAEGGLLPVAGFVAGQQPRADGQVERAAAIAPWSRWRELEQCRWAPRWSTEGRTGHARQLRDWGVIDPLLFALEIHAADDVRAAWDAALLAQAEDLPVGVVLHRRITAAHEADDGAKMAALAPRLLADPHYVRAAYVPSLRVMRGDLAGAQAEWEALAMVFPEAAFDLLAVRGQRDDDWTPLLTAIAERGAEWRRHYRRRQHARWLYEAGRGSDLLPHVHGDAALEAMAFLILVEGGRLAEATRQVRRPAILRIDEGIVRDLRQHIERTRIMLTALINTPQALAGEDATWFAAQADGEPYWQGWAALVAGNGSQARRAWQTVTEPAAAVRAATALLGWFDAHGESGRWALRQGRTTADGAPWQWP